MPTIPISKFNLGMTADSQANASYCQLCKHFDNFTKKSSLIPYRGSEDAYASQTTAQLQNFLMSTNGSMYALGRQAATAKAQILSNSNISTPAWASPTNGQDNTRTISNYDVFFEYHLVLWGSNSNGLWSYDINGTSFTSDALTLAFTNITQGLVHSKDDIAYFGYSTSSGSFIASKNGSAGWNTSALTLPTNLIPVSICEYGNYLAILCKPSANGGKSIVYLWDRDSSLTTISESLDVGNRIGQVIENLDGYLIVVSLTDNTSISLNPKMVFSSYSGGAAGFEVFDEIPLESGQTNILKSKQKFNNRLYFGVSATSANHTTLYDYTGVWSVGKSGPTEPFSVIFNQLANNDTFPTTGGFTVNGFIIVQDYFYISYISNTVFGLSKTNSGYGATSIYRTVVNPNMPPVDYIKNKRLQAIALLYDPFPVSAQVTLRYKVDNFNWQTIVVETTHGISVTEATVDVNGLPFEEGRYYAFEIQDTGGAIINDLAYRYETTATQI